MMTQRRAEELYQNELTKYNEDNSMLTHAAQNERRYAQLFFFFSFISRSLQFVCSRDGDISRSHTYRSQYALVDLCCSTREPLVLVW